MEKEQIKGVNETSRLDQLIMRKNICMGMFKQIKGVNEIYNVVANVVVYMRAIYIHEKECNVSSSMNNYCN